MRRSFKFCLSMALLGAGSGCMTLNNPLARDRDPRSQKERQLVAEMNARTEQGDFEGAARVLSQLEEIRGTGRAEPDRRDGRFHGTDISLASHESGGRSASGAAEPADVDALIGEILRRERPQDVEARRAFYQRMPAHTLQQILSSYMQAESQGLTSPGGNRPSGIDLVDASADAPRTGSARRDDSLAAPDPRAASPSVVFGTQDPWQSASPGQDTGHRGSTAPAAGPGPSGNDPRTAAAMAGHGNSQQSWPAGRGPAGAAPTTAEAGPYNPFQNAGNVTPAGATGFGAPGSGVVSSGYRSDGGHPGVVTAGDHSPQNPFRSDIAAEVQPVSGTSLSGVIQPVQTAQDTGHRPAASQALPSGPNPLANPFDNQLPVIQGAGQAPSVREPQPGFAGTSPAVATGYSGYPNGAGNVGAAYGQTLKPAYGTAAPAGNAGRADINVLIAELESKLASTAPGNNPAERLEWVRRHVDLRMLHLVAGDVNRSMEPIPNVPPEEQEFWQNMLWSMASYFDQQGMPDSRQRAAQAMQQMLKASGYLRSQADLGLRNVSFCHRISSFGNYDRFSREQFAPGQLVLLYAEIENFQSDRNEQGYYRTALQSTIEIHRTGSDQQPVESISFEVTEDQCRNLRRDYFHSYEFEVPRKLEPGRYTLTLRVTDELSRKVATSTLNFAVADQEF